MGIDTRALNMQLAMAFIPSYIAFKFNGVATCSPCNANTFYARYEIPDVGCSGETMRVRKGEDPLRLVDRITKYIDSKFAG